VELAALRIDRQGGAARRPRRRKKRWIFVLGALVAALGAWIALSAGRPVDVTLGTVRAVTFESGATVLNASGYVTPRRRATVSSKITGKVVEVHVEEGMEIAEGQVLARLDDSTQRSALALAEASLSAAQTTVGEIEARLKLARRTLARQQDLVRQGVTGQADLDTAESEAEANEAQLLVAREHIKVAEREVALRRIDLDDTRIKAPFAGVAVSKDAQPGEMVSPISAGGGFTRTGICTIVDMSSLEIEVDVNENYIGRVHPAQKVLATLDAYPDWKIPAHVLTTVPTADRQKATVKVRIAFESLDPKILPDMGAKVAFLGDEAREPGGTHLVVPRKSVHKEGKEEWVFVVTDGKTEKRTVKTGGTSADDAEVLKGLAEGDRVVVEGPEDLAEGRKVRAKS